MYQEYFIGTFSYIVKHNHLKKDYNKKHNRLYTGIVLLNGRNDETFYE